MAGISLVDGLVAIVVLAIGLGALSRFHGEMIAAGRVAKTRIQAVILAQQKMEELRTNFGRADYAGRTSGSDRPVSGAFRRRWRVTNGVDPERKEIEVTVGWTNARQGERSTSLRSTLTWDNPALSAVATDPGVFSATGAIPLPSGGGLMGDKAIHTLTPDDLAGPDNGDGTRFVKTAGGQVLLLDSKNRRLLTASPGMLRISGSVSLDAVDPPGGFSRSNLADLVLLVSDAGVCTRALSAGRLDYHCYVGSRWFGRLGLMARSSPTGALIPLPDYGTRQGRACPATYRYASNEALTRDAHYRATADDAVMAPFLAGTLDNQNIVIMGRDGECMVSPDVSGGVSGTSQ